MPGKKVSSWKGTFGAYIDLDPWACRDRGNLSSLVSFQNNCNKQQLEAYECSCKLEVEDTRRTSSLFSPRSFDNISKFDNE